MSPELSQKIAVLRQKAAANQLSQDDMRQALVLLREARGQAHTVSAASKAKKAPVNGDDLLSQLDGL